MRVATAANPVGAHPIIPEALYKSQARHHKHAGKFTEVKLLAYFDYSSEGENITRCNFPVHDQEVLTYTCVQSHVFAARSSPHAAVSRRARYTTCSEYWWWLWASRTQQALERVERERGRGWGVRERGMGRSSVVRTKASTGTLRVHSSSCDW